MKLNGADPEVLREVIAFLREWMPPQAIRTYRAMIEADPEGWHHDPHFQGGVVVDHLLRGNGITEQVLGVESLEAVWPELLRRVVIPDPEPGAPETG